MRLRPAQSSGNRRRLLPLYHLVAMPVLLANVVVQAVQAARQPSSDSIWAVALALALVGALIAVRASTLVVQSRLIALEMRLRLATILPPELRPMIPELHLRQLVGLRFASDEELPALVQRCLSGELVSAEQVKYAIVNRRADHPRA